MSFTSGNDTNILQESDSAIVGAGAGDDIYIVSQATIADNQQVTISDTSGINTLQLIDGLTISSSMFANDAVQLTLSNGAVITVLGAAAFTFDVGGNALLGTTGELQDFATFASDTLGTTVPAEGEAPVQGGATTIGSGTVVPPPVDTTPDNIFTLTEIPSQTETTLSWNGVEVEEAIAFLQTISGLNLEDLGVDITSGDISIDSINVSDSATGDSSTVTVTLDNGEQFDATVNTPVALYAQIMYELHNETTTTQTGIVLTPTANNGGSFEPGFTTADNDLIVAGRPELLHGAYIDGGAGYNTLEVDMKGFFAQPFQLLNIQEVRIQNLPNVYDVDQTILDGVSHNFPISNIDDGDDSILDLSRASDLQNLVITESGAGGDLTVLGIKNNPHVDLSGGYDNDITLHFNGVYSDQLNVSMHNVTFDGNFTVAHNVGALNIFSGGHTNVLDGSVNFGDYFQELYVQGYALLFIEGDLEFAFGEAYIDASENTGGLRVNVNSLDDTDLDVVAIMGSQARDVITLDGIADGALLSINTNTGRDTLIIDQALSAGKGSSITGEDLTVQVNDNADLRLADVSGVDDFVISADGGLLLTLAQVTEVGIANFSAAHNTVPVLTIELTEDAVLSDIIDLAALDSDVKLAFSLKYDATLTLTAEELHTYLTENAVAGDGSVVITGAGLEFDEDDAAINTANADVNGAILGDGFGTIEDASVTGEIHIIRAQDGYERPLPDANSDTLIINTTGEAAPVVIDGLDASQVETLIIMGDQDVVFTDTVSLDPAGFTIDFSDLTGALIGLTVEDFNNVDEVIGNGAEGVRIDVMLSGDVAEEGLATGLLSSGVEQYVVVDINDTSDDDGDANDDTASFHLCDNTQDVKVIGLQGNAGNTLTFTNVPWGAVNPTILFEGDGYANWDELPKAAGDPNASNVGTIVAEYFFEGAPAEVLITNQGVAPGLTTEGEARPIVVDGIVVVNAASLNITVQDGNGVISSIAGDASLEDVTLTSAFDVTLHLDNGEDAALDSIDASAVAGDATLVIDADQTVNLSETELTDIDALVLADDAVVTLTLDQITDIDVVNIVLADDATAATLNIGNYDGTEFDFSSLALEGISVNIVETLEGEDIVVDPATDFTGVSTLSIAEGSHVTITADQFKQLVDSGATIETQGAGDDLGSLTVDLDGDLTIGTDDETTINNSNVTFEMADGEVLNVEDFSLADGLQVTGDATAVTKSLVNFTFETNEDMAVRFLDTIDVAGYQDVDLRIFDTLLNNFWIDASGDGLEQVGENSQSIEDLLANLASANILNIYQEEAVADLDPRDREVVVESLASPDGIEFSAEGALADYVRSIDLTLEADAGSAASINGDLLVNDGLVEAGYTTLTINAVDTDGAAVGPVTIDGNIYSEGDDGAGFDGDLLSVTINAGVDVLIGDGLGAGGTTDGNLVFSSLVADAEATLTLTGEGDVTMKSVQAGTNVATLNMVTTGYTGTLTVTAGSDAIEMGAATALVFTGDADIVLDTDDVVGNNGIEGDSLTSIDASEHTGSLTLSVIEDVSETDFTFTAGTGTTTATLTAILNADSTAVDPVEPGWTLNTEANTTLTLLGSTFTSGALIITGTGTVVFDGNGGAVDLTALVDADGNSLLDFSADTTIELAPDTELILTPAQLDALNAAGVTFVNQAFDPLTEVEAEITVIIPTDADLTAANVDLDADLDLSQADNLILNGDATLTGAQVSGKTVTENVLSNLILTGITAETDLSGITVSGSLTAVADAAATSISLAAAAISGVTLTVEGDALTDVIVTGVEDVVVTQADVDALGSPFVVGDIGSINADFSNLTADGLDVEFQLDSTGDVNLILTDFAAIVGAGSTTLTISGTGTVTTALEDGSELNADTVSLGADATLSIEAAEHNIGVGALVDGTGTLEVNDLGADIVTIDTGVAGNTVDYMLSFTDQAGTGLVTIQNFTADTASAQDTLDFSAALPEGVDHDMTMLTALIATVNQTGTNSIVVLAIDNGGLVTVEDAAGLATALTTGGGFVDGVTPNFGFDAARIFMAQDAAGNTDVYLWNDSDGGDGAVQEVELDAVATIEAVGVADFVDGNFLIA